MPTISFTTNLDDPKYAEKKAESADELLRFVEGCRSWINDHLKDYNPEQAAEALRYFRKLEDIAKREPVESQAALCGAVAVWHMLFDDANKHGLKRNIPGSVLSHQKSTVGDLIHAIDECHRANPNKIITDIRRRVAAEFGYANPDKNGAKYVAKKTEGYNPCKK